MYKLPDDGVHSSTHILNNIVSNQSVYNADRYPGDDATSNALLHYCDGARIPVVYFSQMNPSLLGKTNPTDISTGETHNSHMSYMKIVDFPIALDQAIDYSYSEDDGFMTATGTATTISGFIPKKGDFFYYLLNDGQWGVMAVRGIQRLSISTVTRHRINFELQEYLTPSRQDYIESSVVESARFDQMMYYTNPYTILRHDSYTLYKRYGSLYTEMLQYYYDKFYSSVLSSYVSPKGEYDPYLVEYLQRKYSVADNTGIRRPKQLYSRLRDYTSSIWTLLSGDPVADLTSVKYHYTLPVFQPSFWSADITSLAGYPYIELSDTPTSLDTPSSTDKCYAQLSLAFYTGDTVYMSLFERALYDCVLRSTIDPHETLSHLEGYKSWDDAIAFYHIPIALYLSVKARFSLKS